LPPPGLTGDYRQNTLPPITVHSPPHMSQSENTMSRASTLRICSFPPINSYPPPLPSPVGTDISRSSSYQGAPSLVSDNQSNYSISPKTMPSPRPEPLVHQTKSPQLWHDYSRPNSAMDTHAVVLGGGSDKSENTYLAPVRSATPKDSRMNVSSLLG
jgi:hypothetical protein